MYNLIQKLVHYLVKHTPWGFEASADLLDLVLDIREEQGVEYLCVPLEELTGLDHMSLAGLTAEEIRLVSEALEEEDPELPYEASLKLIEWFAWKGPVGMAYTAAKCKGCTPDEWVIQYLTDPESLTGRFAPLVACDWRLLNAGSKWSVLNA